MNTDPPALLIVEDDEDISDLLVFMLERENFEVQLAADGGAAREIIRTLPPPSLVMLDIMLPYVSGYQLLADIREQAEWANVPVMMVSTKTMDKDIKRALNSGATRYVTKPFDPLELITQIKAMIGA